MANQSLPTTYHKKRSCLYIYLWFFFYLWRSFAPQFPLMYSTRFKVMFKKLDLAYKPFHFPFSFEIFIIFGMSCNQLHTHTHTYINTLYMQFSKRFMCFCTIFRMMMSGWARDGATNEISTWQKVCYALFYMHLCVLLWHNSHIHINSSNRIVNSRRW